MLQFGLRLGVQPRQIVTTTPRPTGLIKRLLADPSVAVTRMRTDENAANLAPGFLKMVERRYAGTRLGRQELDGEMIEDREDALWSRRVIEQAATEMPGALGRIVVAVDPPASSRRTSDACGIVAAGLGGDGIVFVLADATVRAARPQEWAARAVALYHRLQADCLVVEVNQGGEMATAVIRTVDPVVPVKPVRARRGKWLRAEPVAALPAGQGAPCRLLRRTGRRNVRFRPERAVERPLAGSGRRACLGRHRAFARLGGTAPDSRLTIRKHDGLELVLAACGGQSRRAPRTKSGLPGGFIAFHAQGEAHWTRRDYAALAHEGFMRNPIVHRSVRLIAETASAVPWLLYEGRPNWRTIRCFRCWSGRTRIRPGRRSWRRSTAICFWPATPMSR